MLVDSHCHLDFPDLRQNLEELIANMATNKVDYALIAGVTLERFPAVKEIAEKYPQIFAAVGVHPDSEDVEEPTVDTLLLLANHPKIVAIGETGLDYYRLEGNLDWQRNRFRTHIQAALQCEKPLIIHTRSSAADTMEILRQEGAGKATGVFHCFTESEDVARQALDLGFYISISGIVSFKNAEALRQVAKFIPSNRLLVETDSPYLAPVPHRGKVNQPSFVYHVAQAVADVRGTSLEQLAEITTNNFFNLFKHAKRLNA